MKYKLLKDLPNKEKGNIAVFYNGDYKCPENNIKPGQWLPKIGFYWDGIFTESNFVNFQCDLFPDWFEPIKEWPKTWEELGDVKGVYITGIIGASHKYDEDVLELFATQQQAKSALAFAQLTQLAKAINGDWEPDWSNSKKDKHVVYKIKNQLLVDIWRENFYHISFHSKKAAEFSLEHHRELWEDYWMISK